MDLRTPELPELPDLGDLAARAGAGLSVGQLARAAGITVRTLHHYDEIGLLRPSVRTAAGYRRYTAGDVARLQRVLGYRELGLGLDDIAALLDGEADPVEQLRRQRRLVADRIAHLTRVLDTLDLTLEARTMGLDLTPAEMLEVFGEHDPTQYDQEAEQRWGGTDAWQQSRRRTARYGKDDWLRIKAEAAAVNARFTAALAAGEPADGEEAMAAAEEHRQHIHRWFYDLGYEMHLGLAEMYLADLRFTATYEQVAPGLAQYVHDAILANAARHTG
jgi:MerR family transcriptional regulator, thiopeptide resistance regulator